MLARSSHSALTRAIWRPKNQSESMPSRKTPRVTHRVITWPSRVDAAMAIAVKTRMAMVTAVRATSSWPLNDAADRLQREVVIEHEAQQVGQRQPAAW